MHQPSPEQHLTVTLRGVPGHRAWARRGAAGVGAARAQSQLPARAEQQQQHLTELFPGDQVYYG